MTFMSVEDAATLIRLEYEELPDLALTGWQAQQLWQLSEELCERAMARLTRSGFLAVSADGRYVRRCGALDSASSRLSPGL
jgi:hypothetical protein